MQSCLFREKIFLLILKIFGEKMISNHPKVLKNSVVNIISYKLYIFGLIKIFCYKNNKFCNSTYFSLFRPFEIFVIS